MKIKTQDLTGPALDWAVAKAEGYDPGWLVRQLSNPNPETRAIPGFSTDWAQGGPIIEREGLRVERWRNTDAWVAQYSETVLASNGAFRGYFRMSGPTPLTAAMRCFVASRLGAEVDVPDELLLKQSA